MTDDNDDEISETSRTLMAATESLFALSEYAKRSDQGLIATRIGTDCGKAPMFIIGVVPNSGDQIDGLHAIREQITKRIAQLQAKQAAGEN